MANVERGGFCFSLFTVVGFGGGTITVPSISFSLLRPKKRDQNS